MFHNGIDSSGRSAINSRLFLTLSLSLSRKKQHHTIICLPFRLLSHFNINLKSFFVFVTFISILLREFLGESFIFIYVNCESQLNFFND